MLKVLKRALMALSRESRRGPMCEPCGHCPACQGVAKAADMLEAAIVEITEAPRFEADRLAAERHARQGVR